MYFTDLQSSTAARPTIVKTSSTTSELAKGIQDLVDGRIDSVRQMPNSDLNHILNLRPKLAHALETRDGRAVTLSLFEGEQEDMPVDLAVGRLIALLHLAHYLDFTDADILTGVRGLEYMDSLSRDYPQLDAWYSRLILDAVGLSRWVRLRHWDRVVVERGSAAHGIFLAYLRLIIGGLSHSHQQNRFRGAATVRTVRRSLTRSLTPNVSDLHPLSPRYLFDEAGSRLAGIVTSMSRVDRLFGEFVETERARVGVVMSRVLILVANTIERDAILGAIQERTGSRGFSREYLPFHTVFQLGLVGGAEVFLAQSSAGTESPGGMTLTASDLVDAYNPDYMILAGIAFGLREDEQKLGDILVSTQLRLWDPKKVSQYGKVNIETLRGDKATSSVTLTDRFRSGTVSWFAPEVHFGLILSANTLVNSSTLGKKLRSIEPDAIGGEMEGAGVYCVGAKQKVDWIVVKGISDWGHHKTDESQARAARNSANYIIHVISEGGLRLPVGQQY
jgi:nucleoside phosphorylase